MENELILREKHKVCLEEEANKTYKTYTEYWNESLKQFEYLKDLLKDIKGKITLKPKNDSWLNYTIEIQYKNHIFDIGSDYKGKLQIWFKELYPYQQSTVYSREKEEYIKNNKPLSYTFFKLTSKKLLEVFEYYIKLLSFTQNLDSNKEKTNLSKYEEYKEKLSFIAKNLKVKMEEIPISKYGNDKEVYIDTPIERLEVGYNFNSKDIKVSYNIEKYIEMINKIKED